MTLERYIFKSPQTSQIQIGLPDPTVPKEKDTSEPSSTQLQNTASTTPQNTIVSNTPQQQDIKPTISSNQLLDTYA